MTYVTEIIQSFPVYRLCFLIGFWIIQWTVHFWLNFRMVSYDTLSQEFLPQFKNKLRVHRAVRIPVGGDDLFIIWSVFYTSFSFCVNRLKNNIRKWDDKSWTGSIILQIADFKPSACREVDWNISHFKKSVGNDPLLARKRKSINRLNRILWLADEIQLQTACVKSVIFCNVKQVKDIFVI